MRHTFSRIAAALWAGLLVGCAPSYQLTLAPGQATDSPSPGAPVGLGVADSLEVRLGFARYEKATVVFAADIRNGSDRPVLVAPETFAYLPTLPRPAVASAAAARPAPPVRVAAIDPESLLRTLAARQAAEEERSTKISFWEVLTMVSHTVEDVSSLKKTETPEQIAERDARHAQENQVYDDDRAQHAAQADKLYDEHQSHQRFTLRKHLLQPGERITGWVHFPRTDAATHLRVLLYLRERPFAFDFAQGRRRP